jgi:hypothetical protein
VIAFDYAGLGEDLPEGQEDPGRFSGLHLLGAGNAAAVRGRHAAAYPVRRIRGTGPDRTERNYHDAIARLGQLVEACERATPPEPTKPPCGPPGVRTPISTTLNIRRWCAG